MIRSEFAHLELLAEVDALVARLNRWADAAPAWQPAEKCQALVRRLADRASSLRIRLETPLVVATLGGTGTGKSALINALLGEDVVQTGRQRPTTIRPTIICRPDITPEMLGIDPAGVELIQRDLPTLRELVLIDCPDPDTTEEWEVSENKDLQHETALSANPDGAIRSGTSDGAASAAVAGSNLARLRAILPKCDVLLVTATQQKYRSARVAKELAEATHGAQVIFVQTHAEIEDDIREDWRRLLADTYASPHVFFVDSLHALDDQRAGRQPRGEFAALLDQLTRQMAGAAACRIRRANFLDLVAETLEACHVRIDQTMPSVAQLQTAITEQRAGLGSKLAQDMRVELLANRRQWEQRLLGQTASRWGLSPFSLMLRIYQGLGTLMAGAMLYRMRTPAQMALWGAMQGARTWRKQREQQQAEQSVGQTASHCWDPADLRKAAMIVEGYAADAGLGRHAMSHEAFQRDAELAAAGFVARVSADLDTLINRLAQRHTGWLTRWRYELMLAAMLGFLLYRLGRNFFYDSWAIVPPAPVFGLEFYMSAGFWLVLWCLMLLWAFCSRLRHGLQGEIDRLAESWQSRSDAMRLFAAIEGECHGIERFRQDLDAMRQHVSVMRRQIAQLEEG
jgi:hypothetical protein